MKNYVKDNRKGVITEVIKHKPEGVHAKGVATLQLTNVETGEIDVEVRSENIVMDWIAKQAFNAAYAGSFNINGLSYSLTNPFENILLTTWTEPEKANTPTILGTIRGWANRTSEYAGTDKTRGTINKAETTYTTNSDGKSVMSMVFDFPTHACNGTFQSIQWTRTSDFNFAYSSRGAVVVNSNLIDSDIMTYLHSSTQYTSYDHQNNCISVITPRNTGAPSGNPYYNTSRGYKFKMGSSEKVHEVEYRTESGTSYNVGIHGSNVRMTSDNKTIAIGYYTRDYNENIDSESKPYGKSSNYTVDVYNNEGILVDRHFIPYKTFVDGNGLSIYNPSVNMCDIMLDGTIRVWGYTKNERNEINNLVFYYNPFEKRITKTINLNKYLYIPNSVERPNSVYISGIRVGMNMMNITFSHTRNDNSPGTTYYGTYDISNTDKIKHLNDLSYNYGSYVYGTYSIIGSDFAAYSSNTTTSIFNKGNVARKCEKFAQAPSAHTLLAAPITKTQSHTMKVTYEIICDAVDFMDTESFFRN